MFLELLIQEKADHQTGTNSKSKYVTTRIPRYQEKESTTSSSNGTEHTGRDTRNVGQSGSVYLRITKNGPQDVLYNHYVLGQFHSIASGEIYNDRNVQESSADDLYQTYIASMKSPQEARDMHGNYGQSRNRRGHLQHRWQYCSK